jgi:hypothetical protein
MPLLGGPLLSGVCLSKAHRERQLKGKMFGRHPLDKRSKKGVLCVEPFVCPNQIGQTPSLEEWATKKSKQ